MVERRQTGMMAAVVLAPSEGAYPTEARIGMRVCMAARKYGAILRNLGDAVVLMPPLAISEAQLRMLGQALGQAIEEVCGA